MSSKRGHCFSLAYASFKWVSYSHFTIHHSNEMLALLFQMCYSNGAFSYFIPRVIKRVNDFPFTMHHSNESLAHRFHSYVIQTNQCLFFYPLCNSNASIHFLFSSATYRWIICFFFFQCVSETNQLALFLFISFKRITYSLQTRPYIASLYFLFTVCLWNENCFPFFSPKQHSNESIAQCNGPNSPFQSKS